MSSERPPVSERLYNGEPSRLAEELVVALVAAAEACWPRPAPCDREAEEPVDHTKWRFAGRWWNAPLVLRRQRPWAAPR